MSGPGARLTRFTIHCNIRDATAIFGFHARKLVAQASYARATKCGRASKKGLLEPRKMAKPVTLKSTLNLPKTDFPMKARLPEREPEQLAAWEQMGLYDRILESRAGTPFLSCTMARPIPRAKFISARD